MTGRQAEVMAPWSLRPSWQHPHRPGSPRALEQEHIMGKLVVTEFITLDGIIEDPGGSEGGPHGGWSFRHPTPDGMEYKLEELKASDAQLLGRVTYEGFAAAWPAMEKTTGEFGELMNAMPKYVVSTTLTEATWKNSTIISGDVATEVAKLKDRYQGDILLQGSATLAQSLMVHPIALGNGKRLFGSDGLTDLELVESRQAGPDVLLLIYRPAASPPDAS
jgi:dihydrofolate reductase